MNVGVKMKKETLILGIESSCDETAASVVAGGNKILSNHRLIFTKNSAVSFQK